MKVKRVASHPDFRLEGRSKHFQSFWELELDPGEQTMEHQHYESEELVVLLSGVGTVRVADLERRVTPGQVVLVPPRTDHVIANPFEGQLKVISVESRLDLGGDDVGPLSADGIQEVVHAEAEAKRSGQTIDALMGELPKHVDEAVAIRTIVALFDIGGNLSEEIETTLGLDNQRGLDALGAIEKKIMRAVIEITSRYNERGGAG